MDVQYFRNRRLLTELFEMHLCHVGSLEKVNPYLGNNSSCKFCRLGSSEGRQVSAASPTRSVHPNGSVRIN